MHHRIVSGSSEYILVKLGDRLENVTAIGPFNPTFSVYDPDDVLMQTDVAAQVEDMTAKCLVDTATPTNWPSNQYRLFLKMSATPEAPLLGPVEFNVEEI